MKKIISALIAFMILLLPVFAFADIGDLPSERQMPLLVDEGDILTDSEEAQLLSELERISSENACDVAVIIPASLGYKSATQFADDFYDLNGYGYGTTHDGILLMVCMEERDWATSTAGAAQDWFNDSVLYSIEDEFLPYLSSGNYLKAFMAFASRCEDVLKTADRRSVLYLSDQGNFFTDDNSKTTALRTLESYSHVAGCDIVVLTVADLNGQSASDYVKATYDSGDYRHSIYDDKIVMVIDRAGSTCYCVTGGEMTSAVAETERKALEQTVAEKLSGDTALSAVQSFCSEAKQLAENYYMRKHTGPDPVIRTFQPLSGSRLLFSCFIGLIVAMIVTGSMKAKLRSVGKQLQASDYLKRDSLQINEREDLFLYASVSKTLRSTDSGRSGSSGGHSSSHFSSSGVSHGGHSGKF